MSPLGQTGLELPSLSRRFPGLSARGHGLSAVLAVQCGLSLASAVWTAAALGRPSGEEEDCAEELELEALVELEPPSAGLGAASSPEVKGLARTPKTPTRSRG